MKRMRMLALGIGMMAIGSGPMAGAVHAKSFGDGLSINYGDAHVASCTAATTHCMRVEVCDALGLPDFFQWMAIGVTPSGLLGKMEDDRAMNETCSNHQLCRPAGTTGPIKAVIGIVHVSGTQGNPYNLEVECFDKNGLAIDDSKTTLKRTTENH